jgi:hypothetical protein
LRVGHERGLIAWSIMRRDSFLQAVMISKALSGYQAMRMVCIAKGLFACDVGWLGQSKIRGMGFLKLSIVAPLLLNQPR